MESRSQPSSSTLTFMPATACTASVCSQRWRWPASRRSRTSAPISATGWTVPISLLASMTATSTVSSPQAAPLQLLADAARRRVLDCRRDDVATARALLLAEAADGEVVGLSAAGEEADLVRARADERRDLAA